jgi:hypothetical protein
MKQIFKAVNWLAGSADNHPGVCSKAVSIWALVVLATITQFTW